MLVLVPALSIMLFIKRLMVLKYFFRDVYSLFPKYFAFTIPCESYIIADIMVEYDLPWLVYHSSYIYHGRSGFTNVFFKGYKQNL